LSDTDEPDLWQKDLTGSIVHWIEVGLPEEKRLIRASGRADRVTVYAYGRGADQWWAANAERLARAKNLAVWRVPTAASESVVRIAQRAMQLQCTIQEAQIWFSGAALTVQLEVVALGARD
jgi:uncharacterized protein YaeQ